MGTKLPDPLNVHKSAAAGGMGLPDPAGLFDHGKAPELPAVPVPPPPPPPPPSFGEASVNAAAQAAKRKAAFNAGAATVATSPQGILEPANTTQKSLMGQ